MVWNRSVIATLCTTAVLVSACAARGPSSPAELQALYDQSVLQAAVKRPDDQHVLTRIDPSRPTVSVVHLQYYPTLDEKRYIWVALPEELRAACRGKPDPVLALQQILGLPPEPRSDWKLARFDVATTRVFRPCLSGQGLKSDTCGFVLDPEAPAAGEAAKNERYVFGQAASSWRAGFPKPGFPFTGMGWSYNWSPDAPRHHGISEYVVRPGSPPVRDLTWTTPAEFCAP